MEDMEFEYLQVNLIVIDVVIPILDQVIKQALKSRSLKYG